MQAPKGYSPQWGFLSAASSGYSCWFCVRNARLYSGLSLKHDLWYALSAWGHFYKLLCSFSQYTCPSLVGEQYVVQSMSDRLEPQHKVKVSRSGVSMLWHWQHSHSLVNNTASVLIANTLARWTILSARMWLRVQETDGRSHDVRLQWVWACGPRWNRERGEKNFGNGNEAGRERGLRWRPQMLLLLAVRCQHEIETVLKTLGQDSNLQPQQSETGYGGKTIHHCWHVGDGKSLGNTETRK